MDFQKFISYLPKITTAELPGDTSHVVMAPFERNPIFETIDLENRNPKPSAVLMLCYPKDGATYIVLIIRNSYNGIHSAQIAFPGGKFESGDVNLPTTALRETEEEIGVNQKKIEIIRSFTPLYIPPSNYMVHPFLGICHEEIEFIANPLEVVEILELPLASFLTDDAIITTTISNSYLSNINLSAFEIQGHIIWGATAMVLNEFKCVLKSIISN